MNRVKDCILEPDSGWIPDVPDLRDHDVSADAAFEKLLAAEPPTSVDLSDRFLKVETRPPGMGASAFACGELIEYFLREFEGNLNDVSKWFLHHVTRRFCKGGGQAGSSIRATLKAVARAGVPPARYESSHGGIENGQIDDPVLFTYARGFEGLAYHRVKASGDTDTLEVVRCLLSAGLPLVFGFSVPSSVTDDARIDCHKTDSVIALSAGILVGYDNEYRIAACGALKFRSMWGPQWGENGYGWLPYNLLTAFEEMEWQTCIDDPLPPSQNQDSKLRLHETIKSLNKRQLVRAIRFRGDGTGTGVRWELRNEVHKAEGSPGDP